MDISTTRYNIFNQPLRNKHIKIEVYDFSNTLIDVLQTKVISGNLTFDADNDLRRSGSLELAVPAKFNSPVFTQNVHAFSLVLSGEGHIWYDRYLKIFIGIENITLSPLVKEKDKIEWFNMGCYLVDKPSEQISATEDSLSFNLLDRMAELSDQRQGQLPNLSVEIRGDEYINGEWVRKETRTVIVDVLTNLCGITKYAIADIPSYYQYLPYSIKVSAGATKLQLLQEIRDTLPNWEFFFDENGVFIFQEIPNGLTSPTLRIPENQVISNTSDAEFTNVKNEIIIYGKTHETTFFAKSARYANDTELQLDFDSLGGSSGFTQNTFTAGSTIGFTTPDNGLSNPTINYVSFWYDNFTKKIFGTENWSGDFYLFPYENADGNPYPDFPAQAYNFDGNQLAPNTSYVLSMYYGLYDENKVFISNDGLYDTNRPALQLLSHLQVKAVSVNNTVRSPFYINRRLTGENYYGGLSNLNNLTLATYSVSINDIDVNGIPLTQFNLGTRVTFMPQYPNTENNTSIYITNQDGSLYEQTHLITTSKTVYQALPQNSFVGDYTIFVVQLVEIAGTRYWYLEGRLNSAIPYILTDGEYGNLSSDYIAQIRADYELYLHSYLPNTINLNVIPNYLYNVNQKIEFGQTYKDFTTKSEQLVQTSDNKIFQVKDKNTNYLIKKISFNLDSDASTMDITAMEILQ
jgi:hypothetical protein